MGLSADIRKNIECCADCINCQLQIWEDCTTLEKMDDKGYVCFDEALQKYFLVRCNWLKKDVIEPVKLLVCEGKVSHQQAKEKRSKNKKSYYKNTNNEADFDEALYDDIDLNAIE